MLEDTGHRALAPDPPSHGADTTPVGRVTPNTVARCVAEVVEPRQAPVVVVGHGMGGSATSWRVEAAPEAISRLVYLTTRLPPDSIAIADECDPQSPRRINEVDAMTLVAEMARARLHAA